MVKKTDCNTKINEIEKKITDHNHDKYITTPEFNKLTAENFAARLAQANLVTKKDFDNKLIIDFLINSIDIDSIDSIYFHGKSYFGNDGT